MSGATLRFGAFIGPHHATDENPTLAIERDLQLVQHLDELDFDEVWIGEHHSGGFEIVPAPEIFLAAAAERTKHIRLGTGVKSLPYYHPYVIADQLVFLDHLTRGRVMFGAGPGALPSDAYQMGVDVAHSRRRLMEGLEAIIPLMKGETVTMKTDWFTLENAKLQMASYTQPMMELAVTSIRSPSGAEAAGKHGGGLLVLGGISDEALANQTANWRVCEETAARHGQTVDRRNWRITVMMHLAETREQARAEVEFGIHKWVQYSRDVLPNPPFPEDVADPVGWGIENKLLLIGTPDDAISEIERAQRITGGFGVFLAFAHNFADWGPAQRSYEMFARYVMPRFKGTNVPRVDSYNAAKDRHDGIRKDFNAAVDVAKAAYQKTNKD